MSLARETKQARIHVVSLRKGDQFYMVKFGAQQVAQALRQVGRWACDRRLNFAWTDAALMAREIRRQVADG